MDELIRRQDAIDAVEKGILAWSHMPKWREEKIIENVKVVPSAQPEQVAIANVHFDEEKLKEIVRDSVKGIDFVANWIPCSERLPEDNGHYLVTVQRTIEEEYREELGGNGKSAKRMRFYNGEWKIGKHIPDWINEVIHDTVIAWMPLPEPYEEKPSWLGKNCKDCCNERCKELGTLPKGYDCALWQGRKRGIKNELGNK